jgi:hypothetical protein
MKLIQSTHLLQWADHKDAELFMPLLLRKLIIASCEQFPNITLPAINSVYKPGVDGYCQSENGGLYVPAGLSIWEFGRSEDFKDKYRRDFDKRKLEISEDVQHEASFIFVTLRRWVKVPFKDEQAVTDQQNTGWKSVRILDADDLETWLEQCPQVAAWLSTHLNIHMAGLEAADHYWDRVSKIGDRNLTTDLIIAGRQTQQEAVIKFIDTGSGILEIQGTSRDETIAFLIAACIGQGIKQQESFFSKALLVSDPATLKEVCATQRKLIIIYDAGDDKSLRDLNLRDNKVIFPVSFKVRPNGLTLPIPKTADYTKQLEDFGVNYRRAYRLARECGKSMTVFTRFFSDSPGRVNWAQGNDPVELIPLFFIQRFDANKPGDRQVVELLAGEPFDQYVEKLKKWSLVFDKPIIQATNIWQVVAPYDLFFAVGRYMTEGHFERMRSAFFQVMGETDPALDLDPKLRYAAVMFNKSSDYSRGLKSGFCNSLILLSIFSASAGVQVSFQVRGRVESMIRQLLLNKDVKFWQSIENYLHILAEAAPAVYLDALETMVKNEPDVIAKMFDDGDFDLFTPTYHSHILWSLEALAWDKAYLGRVSLVLANLVLIDKGKKTANRPINSLKQIFSLWQPQTYVLSAERYKILKTLTRKNPSATFQLLLELVPTRHSLGFHNYQPLWRLREYYPLPFNQAEFPGDIELLVHLIADAAGADAGRWAKIVDYLDDLSDVPRRYLLDCFDKITTFNGPDQELRQELHDFVTRHKIYADQNWAIPPIDRNVMEGIYKRLTQKAVDRHAWLFNTDHIEGKRAERLHYQEQEKQLIVKRKAALAEVLAEDGVNAIIELAPKTKYPGQLGYTLAEISREWTVLITPLLFSSDRKLQLLAMVYLNQAGQNNGTDWVIQLCNSNIVSSTSQKGILFTAFKPSNELWDHIDAGDTDARETYWKSIFKEFSPSIEHSDLERCVRKLNHYKRFTTSLNLLEYRHKYVASQLLYDTLDGLVSQPSEKDVKLYPSGYDIAKMFVQLDDAEGLDGNMAALEWKYFEVLKSDNSHERPIKYIYPALNEQPAFFAQVVSWVYIPETSSKEKELAEYGGEHLVNRAKLAFQVLEAWNDIPGQSEEGVLDFEKLKSWSLTALEECKKLDRANKGYYKIGEILGQLRDGNPSWPQHEICELLELLDNESAGDGFVLGVINGRGPKVRINPVTDGSVEAAKSSYYSELSEKISAEYPIVGNLLHRISRHYDFDSQATKIREAQRDLE